MAKTVVIVGALDTKGREFAFVKDLIEKRGLKTLVVDFGVLGEPSFKPDVTREEVASAGGGDLAYLRGGQHKDEAMRTMAAGLAVVVRRLYDEGRLNGILGMGGTGGTSIATTAMRVLPVGVPKVMVSTVGGGDVSAYAGTKDITFMPSIVDVAGINRVSRAIYANAAGAIAGMVQVEAGPAAEEKPLIAASMFGNTTPCVDRARASSPRWTSPPPSWPITSVAACSAPGPSAAWPPRGPASRRSWSQAASTWPTLPASTPCPIGGPRGPDYSRQHRRDSRSDPRRGHRQGHVDPRGRQERAEGHPGDPPRWAVR